MEQFGGAASAWLLKENTRAGRGRYPRLGAGQRYSDATTERGGRRAGLPGSPKNTKARHLRSVGRGRAGGDGGRCSGQTDGAEI